MESAAQQFRRVLLALEDLAAQEELLIATEDFAAVPPLQRRAEPLVECLVAGAPAADAALRQRVRTLIERRFRSAQQLAGQLRQVREKLNEIQVGRQRIGQVAPAYRQRLDTPSLQLSARG